MNINYDNSQVRRQDRLLDKERAMELLSGAEYGVLAMIGEDNKPYAIPVNYVFDGNNSIYVHCAPEGKKLRAISKNNNVELCIVGKVNLLPGKFTTEYESIVVCGKAFISLPPEERMKAIESIIDKFSSSYKIIGMKYAQKSFHRTEIIRIDINQISGKCKKIH